MASPRYPLVLSIVAIAVAAAPARAQTHKAFVASTPGNAVIAIDTTTETVVGSVATGTGPTRIAMSADGSRAYVLNRDADSISVIDTAASHVVGTIAVGDSPASLAVTPDGTRIYVVLAAGVVQAVDIAAGIVLTDIPIEGNGGGIAISPDGAYAWVASGGITLIATATNTIADFFYLEAGNVHGVAISPDGARAYFLTNGLDIFGSQGGVVVLDTATCAVIRRIVFGMLPGQLALGPDGGRLYVGIQSVWVNTGYGAAFIPGRSVAVIDTVTNAWTGSIDLGAGGAAWTLQNTAAGIGVAPDRSDIYVAVPRLGIVEVISTSTNVVRKVIPAGPGLSGLAVVQDPTATPVPYVINAVDDTAALSIPSTGGTAVTSVFVNDRLGGLPVTTGHVALTEQSSTDPHIFLNTSTGSVGVSPGAPVGPHELVYRICELGSPLNCDEATVRVSVRLPQVIDAVNDSATSLAGATVVLSVIANDTVGGGPVTLTNTKVTFVSSTNAGLALVTANASVWAAPGTPVGAHTLVYRICEIADPGNCDTAVVTVNIIPLAIDAVNDVAVSTRGGGVAHGNVLVNDTFAGAAATLAKVKLSFVSATGAGITLSVANGAVLVAAGTPSGAYTLVYRICEIAAPANCDSATVAVTVNAYVINAVNDSARGSSKVPATVLANVLANDFLGSVRATTATVTLSQVSLSPATSLIRLDTADGSVDVLGKVNSVPYSLVYRICEKSSPGNCDTATVTLDLSGGF